MGWDAQVLRGTGEPRCWQKTGPGNPLQAGSGVLTHWMAVQVEFSESIKWIFFFFSVCFLLPFFRLSHPNTYNEIPFSWMCVWYDLTLISGWKSSLPWKQTHISIMLLIIHLKIIKAITQSFCTSNVATYRVWQMGFGLNSSFTVSYVWIMLIDLVKRKNCGEHFGIIKIAFVCLDIVWWVFQSVFFPASLNQEALT